MKNFIGIKKIGANKKALEKLTKQKSLSTLKGELQKVFNEYIRRRDTLYDKGKAYFDCISCSYPKDLDEMHAGHFFSVGGHEAVRFDEDNVHGQCRRCNYFLSGNPLPYKVNLIKKIGEASFKRLELRSHNLSKMARFEVELLIQQYKDKIEYLKKK